MLIAAEKKGDKSWCGDCDDGKFVSESLYIYIYGNKTMYHMNVRF